MAPSATVPARNHAATASATATTRGTTTGPTRGPTVTATGVGTAGTIRITAEMRVGPLASTISLARTGVILQSQPFLWRIVSYLHLDEEHVIECELLLHFVNYFIVARKCSSNDR